MLSEQQRHLSHEGSITDVEAPQPRELDRRQYSPGPGKPLMHQSMEDRHTENPFIYNLYSQALWSSGKSRDSEQRLSFGNNLHTEEYPRQRLSSERRQDARRARTQFSEEKVYKRHLQAHQSLSHEISEGNQRSRSNEAQRFGPSPDDRIRSQVYRLALAQMGEKACMRFALKDVLGILEGLNSKICRQSVQQEIVMTQEDPAA